MSTSDWFKYRDDEEWSLWDYVPSRRPVDLSLAIGRRNNQDPTGLSTQGDWYMMIPMGLWPGGPRTRSGWDLMEGVTNFEEAAAMAITLWGMEV